VQRLAGALLLLLEEETRVATESARGRCGGEGEGGGGGGEGEGGVGAPGKAWSDMMSVLQVSVFKRALVTVFFLSCYRAKRASVTAPGKAWARR